MRLLLSFTTFALLAGTNIASATVSVAIDLTHQRMRVEGSEGNYDWPISSARSGFSTPGGSFAPTHLELMHYSKKYHMSPMPHAIFFRGGYAIHGTYSTASLGRPASHGCVRLAPGDAATLYGMVQREGARISISGSPPASRPFMEASYPRRRSSTGSYGAPRVSDGTSVESYGIEDAQRPYRRARRYGYIQQPQYYGYSQNNGYGQSYGYGQTGQGFGYAYTPDF